MSPVPGVPALTPRTKVWLAGVAILTVAALAATWVGDWATRLGDADDPRITTRALPMSSLPPAAGRAEIASGELPPDDRDVLAVRDLEFLSWYAAHRRAGAAPTPASPELPETLGDGESVEGSDGQ